MIEPNFRALCAELIKIVEEHCNPDDYALSDVADTLSRARAATLLQQLSAPVQPPADGDVARIAGWLRDHRDQCIELGRPDWAHMVDRAATLLEQQAAPTPIPLAEQWPEFSDCDPEERVWVWNPFLDHWKLSRINRPVHTHWLPANALPVPTNV